MKIAFDAKRAFRNYSGLGNYSRTVISLLSSHYPENEYHLYTPKTGFSDNAFPPDNASIITPVNSMHQKFSSYWRSYHLSKLLNKEKPDIYHGLSHELPRNIESTGVKSVVTIHDLIFIRFPELYSSFDRKIYLKKCNHAVRVADKVIAISEQTKQDICAFLDADESKIEVVYQSYNPLFNKIINDKDKQKLKSAFSLPDQYILYVGTIEERKNLLQILKAIHENRIDIPLIVIGKEKKSYAGKVHSFIRENGLNNIHFLKNVSNSDLPGIYQGASLFVYPSSFEGFGLPVLEALQSGIPVIAGKGSCLEETGGPDSLYVNPENTEELGIAVKEVLQDSSLRKKMSDKGLKFASQFSPEIFVTKLHSLYESLL